MNDGASDWRPEATTPTAAIEVIRKRNRVFLGTGCATPLGLLHELESMRRPPPGVQLIHFLLDGELPEGYPEEQSHFQHKVFFVAQNCRGLLQKNRAECVPVSLLSRDQASGGRCIRGPDPVRGNLIGDPARVLQVGL